MKSLLYKVFILNMSNYQKAENSARIILNGYPDSKKRVNRVIFMLFLFVTALTFVNISCTSKSGGDKVTGIVTPVNLARVAMATNSADIEWTINYDEDYSSYVVYRGTKQNVAINSDYKMVFRSTERYKVKFTDWGLEPGTKYYYKVFTFNTNNEYGASNEVMGETPMSANMVFNGELTEDTKWTKAMSPIVVKGDVTVKSGKTLTIDPGVTVRLSANDLQCGGNFSQKSELIIKGTLKAEGNSVEPIIFMSNERYNTPGDWGGISFENASGNTNNVMKYCKIIHASTAVNVTGTQCILENLQISHILGYGIVSSNAAVAIRYCQINDVGQGNSQAALINTKTPPNANIYNCVLGASSGYGIFIEQGPATIDHCVIAECAVAGIYCKNEALDTVNNNVMVNNRVAIKNAGAPGDLKPDFNNVYNTADFSNYGGAFYSNCTAGANSLNVNPKFVNPDYKNPEYGDFNLDASSQLLKKGMSGSDMGLQNPIRFGIK